MESKRAVHSEVGGESCSSEIAPSGMYENGANYVRQLFSRASGSRQEQRIRPSSDHTVAAITPLHPDGPACIFIDVSNPHNRSPDIVEAAMYDERTQLVLLTRSIAADHLDMVHAARHRAEILGVEMRPTLASLEHVAYMVGAVAISRAAPIGIGGPTVMRTLSPHMQRLKQSASCFLRNQAENFFLSCRAFQELQSQSVLSDTAYAICLYDGTNASDPTRYIMGDQPFRILSSFSRGPFQPRIEPVDNNPLG